MMNQKNTLQAYARQKLMLKVDGWNDKKQLCVNSTEMVTEREIRAMSAG